MTKQIIKQIVSVAMLALACVNLGTAKTLPIPDDCRIIDSICYKFVSSAKTAYVSSYKTKSAERGSAYELFFDYNGRNLIIPSTITIDSEEYTVVGFDNPFRNYMNETNIDTLEVPSTIEKVPADLCRLANVQHAILHEGVKTIGDRAFMRLSYYSEGQPINYYLQDIVLPEGLDSIGDEAFRGNALKKIHLPNSVNRLGICIFSECPLLEEAVLPEGLLSIPICMFNGTAITSIQLPSGLETIEEGAFCGTRLTSIELPSSLKEIGRAAFKNNSQLTSISFNEGLEVIGEEAFSNCPQLASISFDKALKAIGQGAFANPNGHNVATESFMELVLPGNLTSIGEHAFQGCPLKSIVSDIEDPRSAPLPETAFDDSVFLYKPLYVPKGSVEDYRRTIYWNKFYEINEKDSGDIPGQEKCATPTISYSDGKIRFDCETEGATFQSTITDSDISSFSSNEVQLTATYNICVYATKAGYNDSDMAYATLCWIEAEPKVDGVGITQVPARPVMIQMQNGILSITGADDGQPITVYSTDGQLMGQAISQNGAASIRIDQHIGNAIIVKMGGKSMKIVVK